MYFLEIQMQQNQQEARIINESRYSAQALIITDNNRNNKILIMILIILSCLLLY